MKIVLGVCAVLVLLLVVAWLPLPLDPYEDFQVIYHADLGLLRGIPIYDHTGQVNMIAQLAGVSPNQVIVMPFPYPPWYALSTVWLALLNINIAARLWFGLNLSMLLLSVSLLTDGLPAAKRVPLFFCASLFLPALGTIFVGQYGFPVLLGAALLAYALRRERPVLAGLSAALLTFKPHLGILILLMGLAYLLLCRDSSGRRALMAILAAGAILVAVGFLASPLWPVDYLRSLISFKSVFQCQQCKSASPLEGLVGGDFNRTLWFALLLLLLLVGWSVRQWGRITQEPRWLVMIAVLVTLLVSPYLQSYDYALLLVPLLGLAGAAHGWDWLWLVVAYALPVVGFGLLGAGGNVSLICSSAILFGLAALRLPHIAGSPHAEAAWPAST